MRKRGPTQEGKGRGGAPAGGTLSENERGRRKAKSKERLPALRLPHLKEGGDGKEGLASLKVRGR